MEARGPQGRSPAPLWKALGRPVVLALERQADAGHRACRPALSLSFSVRLYLKKRMKWRVVVKDTQLPCIHPHTCNTPLCACVCAYTYAHVCARMCLCMHTHLTWSLSQEKCCCISLAQNQSSLVRGHSDHGESYFSKHSVKTPQLPRSKV